MRSLVLGSGQKIWLVCRTCNAQLNDTEFKAAARGAFEAYQLALRRVIQSRQERQVQNEGLAAS